MHDDPKDIAEYLIQTHGLNDALNAAIAGALDAQYERDNYALSVWREVKSAIRRRQAEQEEADAQGAPPVRDPQH